MLSVYHDDVLQETLSLPNDKSELRKMFQEKGFVKMSPDDIEKMKERRRLEERTAAMKRHDEKVKRRQRRLELEEQKQKRQQQQQQQQQRLQPQRTWEVTKDREESEGEDEKPSEYSDRASRLELIQNLHVQSQRHSQVRANLKNLDKDERLYAERLLGIEKLQREAPRVPRAAPKHMTIAGIKVPTINQAHDEL